jgi:hypothetical protein
MTCRLSSLEGGGTRLELSQGDFARVHDGARRFADASADPAPLLRKMKAVAEAAGLAR